MLMEKGLCLRQGSKGEPGKEAVELPVAENGIDALNVIRSERAQHQALCDNPAHFGKIIAETFVSHTDASGIIMNSQECIETVAAEASADEKDFLHELSIASAANELNPVRAAEKH